MDVDNVLVNGVEFTKGSSLATLRAACSFLGVSGLYQDLHLQQEDGIVERQKLGE